MAMNKKARDFGPFFILFYLKSFLILSANGGSSTPFSVTMAVIYFASVTSNAGL